MSKGVEFSSVFGCDDPTYNPSQEFVCFWQFQEKECFFEGYKIGVVGEDFFEFRDALTGYTKAYKCVSRMRRRCWGKLRDDQ